MLKLAAKGKYHINGKSYKQLFGPRVNRSAYKTKTHLKKYGYGAKKNKFGYVRIGATKKARKGKSRKMRGGEGEVEVKVEGKEGKEGEGKGKLKKVLNYVKVAKKVINRFEELKALKKKT